MSPMTDNRGTRRRWRRTARAAASALALISTLLVADLTPAVATVIDPTVVMSESTLNTGGYPSTVGVDTYGRIYQMTAEHPEPEPPLPFPYTLRRYLPSGVLDTGYGPVLFGGASLAPAMVVAPDGTVTVSRFVERDHRPMITYDRVDPDGLVSRIRSVGRAGHYVNGVGAFDLGDRLLSGIVLTPYTGSMAIALVIDVDTGEVVTEVPVPQVGDIVAVSQNAFALTDGSLSVNNGTPALVPVPTTHHQPRIVDLMDFPNAVIAVGSAEIRTNRDQSMPSARRPLFARYSLADPTGPQVLTIGQSARVFTGIANNRIAVLEEPDQGYTVGQPPPDADIEIAVVNLITGNYTAVAATPDGLAYGGRLRPAWIQRSDGSMTLVTRARNEQLYSYDLWGHPPPLPVDPTPLGPRPVGTLTGQVERLYRAYFDRLPDADGMLHWRTQRAGGLPLSSVSVAFAASAEFAATYGVLDDGQFIDLVYRNVLGRSPDATGRAFWLGQTQAGMTRGAVMTGFSESAEFVTVTGTVGPHLATEDQLRRLYWAYFSRSPDLAGLEFWMAEVRRSSIDAASSAFARSTEFSTTYGPLNDRQFVDLVYRNVLDRAPDEAGRAYWVGQLSGGRSRGQVMTAFSESVEFVLRTDTMPATS